MPTPDTTTDGVMTPGRITPAGRFIHAAVGEAVHNAIRNVVKTASDHGFNAGYDTGYADALREVALICASHSDDLDDFYDRVEKLCASAWPLDDNPLTPAEAQP